MRSEEEFRKEVFKRCDQKLKREKAIRKKTAFSLCIIAVVCTAAVPVFLNNFINNKTPAENNSANYESDGYTDTTDNGWDGDKSFNGEESFLENTEQASIGTGDDQIEIDTGEVTDKHIETEEQDGLDESFLQPSAVITIGEKASAVPPEKTMGLFNLLENALDSSSDGICEESDKTVTYTITFLSSWGEEKYFLSEDGFIKKSDNGQWKKLSIDEQQELESFILEIDNSENSF